MFVHFISLDGKFSIHQMNLFGESVQPHKKALVSVFNDYQLFVLSWNCKCSNFHFYRALDGLLVHASLKAEYIIYS